MSSVNTGVVAHYDASYGRFATDLYRAIREETYGEDIGQNGWLTVQEQDRFIPKLRLDWDTRLLDVACGSGGPALRIAERTGSAVVGIDVHEEGIQTATAQAETRGLGGRARFERLDASRPLPLPDGSLDAIVCVDAINHLPDRARVLEDWKRLLRPGGRCSSPIRSSLQGRLLTKRCESEARSDSSCSFPRAYDEGLIERVGLELLESEDTTDQMAAVAGRWRAAREARAGALRDVEGDETFEGQQSFFAVAERLARERRLTRLNLWARKPDLPDEKLDSRRGL